MDGSLFYVCVAENVLAYYNDVCTYINHIAKPIVLIAERDERCPQAYRPFIGHTLFVYKGDEEMRISSSLIRHSHDSA